MINTQLNKFYSKARILFIRDGCQYCRVWKKFIERINLELPINKRIRIIDCTTFHETGVADNSVIKLFYRHYNGYPTLFFEGRSIPEANTREETEAFIRALVHNDFIIPQENKFLFKSKCKFLRKGIFFKKKRLVCNE